MLTFISGSPEQMRRKLEMKFKIDGIRPDAFILKPQLSLILRGRFRAIRGQIGYKLDALLRVRAMSPLAPETLFGDDAEQDAFIYSMYGDLVAGRVELDLVREILERANVYPDTRELILERARNTPREDTVQRIFIHLDRRSAPGRFLPFGPRVIPVVNYFQAALVLLADGVLSPRGLMRVVVDMNRGAGYAVAELANSFQDLGRRGLVDGSLIDRLEQGRASFGAVEGLTDQLTDQLLARLRALAPRAAPPEREWEGPPNYLEILRADRELREALDESPKKKRGFGLFSGG